MSENQPHFYRGRFSVAPMLDWTTRHCRYFHRQFSPKPFYHFSAGRFRQRMQEQQAEDLRRNEIQEK